MADLGILRAHAFEAVSRHQLFQLLAGGLTVDVMLATDLLDQPGEALGAGFLGRVGSQGRSRKSKGSKDNEAEPWLHKSLPSPSM